MTTSTLLPRLAGDPYGNGWAYYPAVCATGFILWRATPTLPDGPWRWATQDDRLDADCLVFDDVTTAELLFRSHLNAGPHTDAELVAAIDLALFACHADVTVCAEHLAREAGDHPEAAAARMTCCRAWTAQLIGGAA